MPANLFPNISPLPSSKPLVKAEGDTYDWFSSFAQSGVASMGELVGITPSETLLKWRAQNPGAALLSEIGGMAVPYAGWFKATQSVKRVDEAINAIGDLRKAPFLTGVARDAVRFAPFEAGRVVASQFIGDKSLETMAGQAALNLAIGSGASGLIQGIVSAGTRALPLSKLAPGIDITTPRQIQQRFLQQVVDEGGGKGPNADALQYTLEKLRSASRAETLPPGTKYVQGLEGGQASKSQLHGLNQLFTNARSKGGFTRQRLVQSPSDFRGQGVWQTYVEKIGLPKNFEDLGQYYRAISFRGKGAAQTAGRVNAVITKALGNVGDGWFLGRESDSGLFIMARKVAGAQNKAGPGDGWLIFKTDQPGSFVPSQQEWANTVIGKNAWVPPAQISKDGGEIYDTLASSLDKLPLNNYMAVPQTPKGIAKYMDALLPKDFSRKGSELLNRTKEAIREYLAPAQFQFMKNARANHIHMQARLAYDAAETEAQRLLYGFAKLENGKNLFHSMLRGKAGTLDGTSSIKNLLDGLSDEQVTELWNVWRAGAEGDALSTLAKNGKISEGTLQAAQALGELDSGLWTSLNKAQKATGQTLTKRRAGHYGLSRIWNGDSRIVLRGGGGDIVGIAVGVNRRGAQAEAKALQKILADEGITTNIAEEFQLSQLDTIPKELKPAIMKPGFVLERQNIRGFQWDTTPFTRDELLQAYDRAVHGRLKYQANISVEDLLQGSLTKLATEDPHAYKLVVARLNDLAGKQGPLGQIQNKIVDQFLAPMLGQNSASRIVGVSNSIMWTLQLGAMKLAYPVQGAVTMMQTVAPEVAFITSAVDSKLAGSYTYFAAGGTKGPVGSVGALNPLKVMARGMRLLKSPTSELRRLYQRAMNDRLIDPRFVEEYVGESASKLSDIRGAAKSGGSFLQWLKALNEFLPGLSERFQRGHALATGYDIGKNYLKIADEDTLYRFTRQFTEKTMFLYTAADRSRIFTTPAGSFFGLFKNWTMNYMGMMLEYAGEASRGNFAPLLWQTAGTFSVGGLAATPLYLVANGFSNAFTGNSILETTYNAMKDNTQVADGLMYGLPAGLTGISLYSQTASPLSNPVRDANMLFSTVHLDRLQYMSKAVGSAWDYWQATGDHPADAPNFWQQMSRAVAPVTVYRTLGAVHEGMMTSAASGYPVMKLGGLMDKIFYAAGFNPVELDRAYAVSDMLWRKRDARQKVTASLGQAFADAQMGRDNAQMMAVLRQAYAAGIDPSSVLKSSQSRISKLTTPMVERSFKPEDLARFDKVLGGQ